jgi:hypothetical protein
MRGGPTKFLGLLLLIIYVCAPVFEHFDRWDGFPQSGQDIILALVLLATCLSLPSSIVVFRWLSRLASLMTIRPRATEVNNESLLAFCSSLPSPEISPPSPLRI